MNIVRNQYPTQIPPDDRCRLGFVGEAPAEEEFKTGQPFMGSAGRELRRWFEATNIIRTQCFVGNLSQQRAPGDKLERMFLDSACTRPTQDLQFWIDKLKDDLMEIRPNVVVALGNHPLYILTGKGSGKTGITKYWGSILPCSLVPGIKVIPIPHPSWIIRGMFAMRPIIIAFLRRAIEESGYPELKLPEREYLLDPPFEMVMHHLTRLMSSTAFAFDIERPKVKPGGKTFITHISFADSPGWAMSIPFVRRRQLRWHANQHLEILKAIAALFSSKATKIGHNLMFDALCTMSEWRMPLMPPYYDTMTAHNRCYPDLTDKRLKKMKLNGLAFCTAIYTKEPYYKDDYKSENEDNPEWKGSEQEFMLYNAKDSIVAYEIMEATKRDLSTFGVYDIFAEKDMSVFEPLAYMGLRGVKRDKELLNTVTKEATKIIEEVQTEIDREVGEPFNLDSPQQMQRILYKVRGHKTQYSAKTGNATTDETALRKLERRSDDPLIPLILKYRRFNKFFDYLETIIPEDGRTRCTYNQARTTTFRISSSASSIDGSGGNLQNIPSYPRPGEEDYNILIKELKKTYVADNGMLMGRRDYKQGEAIVVAYLAEEDPFIEAFHAGEDMHCHNYAWVSGEDYDQIRDEYLNGNPEYKVKRNLGKKAAHAFNYRMGKRRFKDELSKAGIFFEEKQCGVILQALESNRPKVVQWWHKVEAKLRQDRTMTNCFGRRRFFMGIISDDVIREAIAFEPQSTVGDLLNFSLYDMWQKLKDELDLLLQIHDAVVWQSPKELLEKHAALISECMAIPMTINGRTFTIPTDFACGPSWGELVEQ